MKFSILEKVCPEVEQFAMEQTKHPYMSCIAKYHHMTLCDIVKDDGMTIGQAYQMCYIGPAVSYLVIKRVMKGHATILKGW